MSWRGAGEPPDARPWWTDVLSGSGVRMVAVVGGAGRLGSALVRYLVEAGCRVVVLDSRPPDPLPRVRFVPCELARRQALPATALDGCDAVVHLAALHGAHLVAGVSRRDFWAVNVHGTERVLEAADRAGLRRVVLASSTSVYGSGSPAGEPARVLDEQSRLDPEDVYDLTKVTAERLLVEATTETVGLALRFGRFFFPSHADYHLRKLSTGLDVRDACQAVALALVAAGPARRAYCVSSDLPLCFPDRRRLGLSAPAVLEEALPGFGELARRRGVPLPDRVGKSVCSDAARAELGYLPERGLDWVAQLWASASPARRRTRRLRETYLAAESLPTASVG